MGSQETSKGIDDKWINLAWEARVLIKDVACFVVGAQDILDDVKPVEEVSPSLLRFSLKFQSYQAMMGCRFAELVEEVAAFLIKVLGGSVAGRGWWYVFFRT